MNQLPMGVLGIALGTVLLPEMSKRLARGDRAGSDSAQNRSAALTLLLTLPFVFAFIAIPGVLMRAVFAHGAFDHEAAGLAGPGLGGHGLGAPPPGFVRGAGARLFSPPPPGAPRRAAPPPPGSHTSPLDVLVVGR